MIVLGIDPGTANTGYGVVRHRFAAARARARRHQHPPGTTLERRLCQIHDAIGELIDAHRPDAVAIEELYFGANVRTAFAVGQARGVVLLAAGQRDVPARSYTPQQSNRRSAAAAVPTRTRSGGWSPGCSALAAPPTPDHAADALAVALCDLNRAPLAAAGRRRPPSAPVIALTDGEVAVRRSDHVVVSCGGVGYRLTVSTETLRHVPAVGQRGHAPLAPDRPRRRARAGTASRPRRSATCS